MTTLELRPIPAAATYDLRQHILRPHLTISECAYPGDTAPEALHIGCFLDEQLIGIGSILPDAREHATQPVNWRIRGMAVLEEQRGSGAGGKILQALIDYASSQAVLAEIWCNGRANVKGFYERYGFTQEGDLFDLPHIGPHVLMVKVLPANR